MASSSSAWVPPDDELDADLVMGYREQAWEPMSEDEAYDELWWGESDDDEQVFRRPHVAPTHAEAEEALAGILKAKFYSSQRDATDICYVAHWARTWAGGSKDGSVGIMAKRPGDRSTGHYSRHLKSALGMNEKFMMFEVAGFDKHDPTGRGSLNIPVRNPHSVLVDEAVSSPTFQRELKRLVESDALPDSYMQHPVAKASAYTAQPCLLYLDGVPTVKKGWGVGHMGALAAFRQAAPHMHTSEEQALQVWVQRLVYHVSYHGLVALVIPSRGCGDSSGRTPVAGGIHTVGRTTNRTCRTTIGGVIGSHWDKGGLVRVLLSAGFFELEDVSLPLSVLLYNIGNNG